jgi:ribonucleoside-diphosphate reductase subunit M1
MLDVSPIESHQAKLVGSGGSENRYFDFDKLAEVCLAHLYCSVTADIDALLSPEDVVMEST